MASVGHRKQPDLIRSNNLKILCVMANYTTHSGITFEAPDLLPCPCCGGEAELLFKGNDYTKKRSVTIKCKRCILQRTDAAIRNTAQWCAEVAIEQWNVRKGNPDSQSSANCAIFDVSLSLANQKAVEYAYRKHGDEYKDETFERDISETEIDFARGFIACSEYLKANEG